MKKIAWVSAIAAILSGCAMGPKAPPPPGLTAEEAAERLEESKREYETCVKNLEPGRPTCDSLENLYERDRANYEALTR